MKSSLFLLFAVIQVVIASLYVQQQQGCREQVKNIQKLKRECQELGQRTHTLITELNTIKERSNLEAYARNELGMQKVHPDQIHTLPDDGATT